jgi:hypothetical protein
LATSGLPCSAALERWIKDGVPDEDVELALGSDADDVELAVDAEADAAGDAGWEAVVALPPPQPATARRTVRANAEATRRMAIACS